MMLYVVGLGLSDEKDITVRGLEAVRSCDRIYLEAYTSILLCDTQKLASIRVFMNKKNKLKNVQVAHMFLGRLLW